MKKMYLSVMVVFCLVSVILGPIASNPPIISPYSHGAEH